MDPVFLYTPLSDLLFPSPVERAPSPTRPVSSQTSSVVDRCRSPVPVRSPGQGCPDPSRTVEAERRGRTGVEVKVGGSGEYPRSPLLSDVDHGTFPPGLCCVYKCRRPASPSCPSIPTLSLQETFSSGGGFIDLPPRWGPNSVTSRVGL